MDISVMTRRWLFCPRNSNNSHKIPLLSRALNQRLTRIYAEDEMSLADKSLQKTARIASPVARAQSTSHKGSEIRFRVVRRTRLNPAARAPHRPGQSALSGSKG